MKSVLLAAVAALTLATPAAAQTFMGPRAEAQLVMDRGDDVDFGAAVGYDMAVSPRTRVGVEATGQFQNGDDIYGAAARVGYVLTPRIMPFAKVGYVNHDGDDGYRLGGGAEFAITPNLYATGEYRYTDFGRDRDGSAGLVGIGLRF